MFQTEDGIMKPIAYVGIIKNNKLLLVNYKVPPNPAKSGWWIPAPGLEFGADPFEKARQICAEYGIKIDCMNLNGVESFVSPGGWHLIWHYIVRTDSEPQPNSNVKSYRWVTAEELSDLQDLAHGRWEIGVGKEYLGAN